MKNPFKAFTIAVTGDFGHNRSFDKMRQWIQVNGGTFSYEINPKVTHLISSKEHFKRNKAMVKAARDLQTVKIVSFDWLEDSLMKMYPCNERGYLMTTTAKAHKESRKKKKGIRERNVKKGSMFNPMESFEKSCKEFEDEMNSCNYAIYHDHTGYRYDITLARADILTNKNERHMLKAQRLQLYESHATPKLYACFEKYFPPSGNPTASILAPIGSSFDVAFDHFKKFFNLKTGKGWEDRLQKTIPTTTDFMFILPKVGEPSGVMLNDGQVVKGAIDEVAKEAAICPTLTDPPL